MQLPRQNSEIKCASLMLSRVEWGKTGQWRYRRCVLQRQLVLGELDEWLRMTFTTFVSAITVNQLSELWCPLFFRVFFCEKTL